MYIKRVQIHNFRTLLDFEIELDSKYQIIAGANNSGKSNLLRALNIFFNEGYDEISYYSKERDMPFHITHGTGSGALSTIEVDLYLTNDEINKINELKKFVINGNIVRTKAFYGNDEIEGWYHSNKDGKFPSHAELKKGINNITSQSHPISKLINRVHFIYVPSQFDISERINKLVSEEILPTMVDSYGNTGLSSRIKELTEKLKEVDKLTEEVLKEKNELITHNFQEVIKEFPEIQAGIELEQFALEVELAGNGLAEILSKRIMLNVKDASHNDVDSKGSGIQKLVLITLLEYFSKNIEQKARYTNPFLIWAIDEPETYMQPKLQKKISEIFKQVSQTHQIICTTHSPKMVDIYKPSNVKMFYLTNEKMWVSRKNKNMFKKITKWIDSSEIKFVDTLKEHFGVEANDGWLLRDKNILFEGSDDQIYFHSTFEAIKNYSLDVANITSHSSTNMPSFVEFLHQQIANKELEANSILCLLDNDTAGRDAYNKIDSFKNKKSGAKKYIKLFKTISLYLTDLENKDNSYPSMIEDFVIPEIYFESVLEFIQKKNSSFDRNKYSFEKFVEFRKCLKRNPMYDVLNNFFDEDIKSLEFTFEILDIKYAIAFQYKNILENLESSIVDSYKEKYPQLTSYFGQFEK